ncbi:RNA-directed DNA polymerase, eukaryota, reverse transcriptase zinc-binding domain protein [Tanacetum coccineum]
MNKCSKGCRIALGWNSRVVNVNVLSYSWQVMFCLVESLIEKTKFFCSFVYAANHGKERSDLWKELTSQKLFVNGRPWILIGDFNVTLYSHEHSARTTNINQDMQDFQDCVSLNELEDICSSGFQFTWIKSPSNPTQGILKKLDRVMSNEEFISVYGQAHIVFLPYIISDHCPSLVVIPHGLRKKKKSFRFTNYIVEKPEFLPTIEKE